jgi:adenosylhomocysteine nucleosidase
MNRLAIIAALPGELKPLVRARRRERRDGVDLWRGRTGGCEWVAACAGAGAAAALRAFAEAEKGGAVDGVLSVGWAGALNQACTPGSAYRVSGVVDALTGERFHAAGGQEGRWLVTNPAVAGAREKPGLAATHGADLVDMEAAGLARLAGERGIPFYCVKGVSDGPQERLPDLNRFISGQGRFRTASFLVFALARPWHWPALARMGVHSAKAARNIAATFSGMSFPPAEPEL